MLMPGSIRAARLTPRPRTDTFCSSRGSWAAVRFAGQVLADIGMTLATQSSNGMPEAMQQGAE
jgi:hypothetical protein